jgi:hypothetical protein
MRGIGHWIVGVLALSATTLSAQTVPSPLSTNSPISLNAHTNVSSAADLAAEELVLTGVVNIGSLKRAFVRIERKGEPAQHYTLEENQQVGGVETIAIDAVRASVTLRYRGKVREITLHQPTGASASQVALEKEKDISHTRHHAQRAQLDRENDERLAAEERDRTVKASERQR